MKRVTIKDIANHLCLSPSTVSRALADDKNIRQETKDIVFKAADDLGYRRNRLAVSLRSGRTNIIGVVVDQMVDRSTLHILAGAERLLHNKGVSMMVANSEGSHERERDNLTMMNDALVDGMIVAVCDLEKNRDVYLSLKRNGMSLVFLHMHPQGIIASLVRHADDVESPDYYKLGEKGAELLLNMLDNPSAPTEKVDIEG